MRRIRGDRLSKFQAGLLAIIALCAITYFSFSKALPFRDHYTIRGAFETANNVKPGSAVRIAGVNVGKVTEVERLRGGESSAIVEMRIDDQGLPIHKDARAQIRPRIFLEGNFFVDINPGSPSAPRLDDGDTIPINQTSAPVQLDQILTTLQDNTREDLKVLLDELSTGLDAEGGKGFNRSIRHWEPAYRDGAVVADAQRGILEHDLSNYVKHAGTVAEALDRDRVALKDLITTFNITARAFAREDTALTNAIEELPRTLRVGKPALAELNDAFPSVRRFARDFRPGVRSSGPALDASIPLARQLRGLVGERELRGLVRDLRPTVPELAKLTRSTTTLYEQVRAASSCQNEVIIPWSHDKIQDPDFPAEGNVYEEAPKSLPGLAGESRSGDANGQWFRVLLSGGAFASDLGNGNIYMTAAPLLGVNPPPPDQRSPLRSDVPCETQETPDLRTIPGPPPPSRKIRIPAARQDDYQKVVRQTVRAVNKQLEATGLSDELRATTEWATKDTLESVRRIAEQAKKRNAGR